MNKSVYLEYIKAAALEGRKQYDASVKHWRDSFKPDQFLGMYTPPGHVSVQAQVEAFLYHVTGEREYGEQAKRMLLAIDSFKDIVPDEVRVRHPEYRQGIPSFEPMFQGTHYLHGYRFMKDSGLLLPEDKEKIEDAIRSSMHALLHFPEWGAHNRSMLRVFALTLAVETLGDTEETKEWAKLRDYLAEESFGGWSIEDAELYLPLWLISSMTYAEITGREKAYYAKPQTKYYFDYITHLLTPNGQIPDFGDAHFNSSWWIWLACLEKGAAVYRCGHMKYAACKIFDYAHSRLEGPPSSYLAAFYSYAYLWSDDGLEPVKPDWQSEPVLDDVIGKKLAFRDGWEDDSTYLLLNYRDEGDYAYIPREYLRRTIDAPAEKAHHGHADENSVSILVCRQNILLHDGGYRDQAPNGKYRADIYHNRLVFRDGEPKEGGSVYDFIHDDGTYRRSNTEKLHFQSFGELDYSRTRMTEPYRQMLWDRCVTYLKEAGIFLIVDWTKSLGERVLSTFNLWHPGTVLEAGESHFVGQVRQICRSPGDTQPYLNRQELALLIEFPGSARTQGRETIRRCYADSEMVYEADTRQATSNSMNVFITALTPFAVAEETPVGRVRGVALSPANDQLSLEVAADGKTYHLAYKLDLDKGIYDNPLYPKYRWGDSRLSYGAIETDSDFAFVREGGDGPNRYGFINGCGLQYKETALCRTPQMSSYQFQTGSYQTSDHKWRAWDGLFG